MTPRQFVSANIYWRLRFRMFKAVRINVFGIKEGGPLTKEAIRVWNFLFPDEPINKEMK